MTINIMREAKGLPPIRKQKLLKYKDEDGYASVAPLKEIQLVKAIAEEGEHYAKEYTLRALIAGRWEVLANYTNREKLEHNYNKLIEALTRYHRDESTTQELHL